MLPKPYVKISSLANTGNYSINFGDRELLDPTDAEGLVVAGERKPNTQICPNVGETCLL